MAEFHMESSGVSLSYDPARAALAAICGGKSWVWKGDSRIILSGGKEFFLKDFFIECSGYETGVSRGVAAVYGGFPCAPGVTLRTYAAFSFDGAVVFELCVSGEEKGQVEEVCWPPAFEFGLEKDGGYTVIPQMQGVLIPAKWGGAIADYGRRLNTRAAYMSFFGQTDGKRGYMAVYDDPFDANMNYSHAPGGDTSVAPSWSGRLGLIGSRRIRYRFYESCTYIDFCRDYREHADRKGLAVTLREKLARNKNAEYLIGAPIVHEGIAVHIDRLSRYYDKTDPAKNDYFTPFAKREEQLRSLRARGVEKAYLHLDGWGAHGYDNLHPKPFPVHEAAGGAAAMRSLSDTCAKLGYKFGIHDQYRDYYYDSPGFSFDSALQELDGTHPYCDVWYGGAHSYLCARLAPDYVRSNYDEFERLGIRIDGSYLDVFSIADLDECFNPAHLMTREDCAKSRMEALRVLTARGIIASSEEVIDEVLPAMELCHHAPMATLSLGSPSAEASGVPVPLFSLVYHDCVVMPWYGISHRGGWGVPGDRSGWACALLHGGTMAISIAESDENLKKADDVLALHKKVALLKMTSHEFLDESRAVQRTVFEDGTAVTVDYASDSFELGRA